MRKLTPTIEELEEIRRNAPSGPLVAVNLLKFKSAGGREAYFKYMKAASAAAPSDINILFSGVAGPDFGGGEDWDYVIIVEYPSAKSFADFIESPAYRDKAVPHRANALERTLWMPCFFKPLTEFLSEEMP